MELYLAKLKIIEKHIIQNTQMTKIILFSALVIAGCGETIENTRSFQFTYEVDIESTNGKKLEVWLPVPQTNEVQIISELEINTIVTR